jgi:hypothetical protein
LSASGADRAGPLAEGEALPEPLAREAAEILGAREDGSWGERLEDLFVRFQAQVPYQPAERPRSPEEFLRAFVEAETGSAGDERARAFFALARALSLPVEVRAARARTGWRRVALARPDGRLLLVDPGFPLPCLVPLDRPGEEIPTGHGTLRPSCEGGRYRLAIEARGRSVEAVRLDPGEEGALEPPGAPAAEPGPRERLRLLDDRLLRWRDGRLEVTDGWSRLTHPLGGGEREILEALFRVPCGDLDATPPDGAEAALSVYDLSPLPKASLEERILRLAAGPARAPGGRDEGTALRTREWRLEEAEGGTRVRLSSRLDGVPPRGPAESLRKTLVFLLASELLDLSKG